MYKVRVECLRAAAAIRHSTYDTHIYTYRRTHAALTRNAYIQPIRDLDAISLHFRPPSISFSLCLCMYVCMYLYTHTYCDTVYMHLHVQMISFSNVFA